MLASLASDDCRLTSPLSSTTSCNRMLTIKFIGYVKSCERLGRRQTGEQTHLIIKLNAWLIHKLPVIRAAFPDTPWIFLSRKLSEVIASDCALPACTAHPERCPTQAFLHLTPEDILPG